MKSKSFESLSKEDRQKVRKKYVEIYSKTPKVKGSSYETRASWAK